MIKVTVIGSGAVAEAFAHALGQSLVGVVARNAVRGRQIAESCGVEWSACVLPPSDLYLIAVSDKAIGEVSRSYDFPPTAVVAHTSGCSSLDDLDGAIRNRAVLYPMQTFTAGRKVDFAQIPFFVEGSTTEALDTVGRVAHTLSDNVSEADGAQRRKLHLAATFICNFTNFMYLAGCEVAGEGFDRFLPLARECVEKAAALSPRCSQTGVAVRGDTEMQRRHLQLLAVQHPEYIPVYELLSKTIWETLRKI